MAEKKGFTGKLKYDFNTARAVFIKRGEKYSRLTERDFRSYYNNRYIMINGEYYPYEGPVYYWNTNDIVENPIPDKIHYKNESDFYSKARPSEKYVL